MGLYIKSMRMPKDDVLAFKQITITNNWIDGEVIMLAHDTITNEFIGEVVEVPEPHGRLTDIEDIKKAIFDYHGEDEQKVRTMINAILSSVPTVIEAEE